MTDHPNPTPGVLSDEQVAFLIESGTFTAEHFVEVSARVARGDLEARERKTRQDTIEASLSADEAAARLGVDVAEVRHRAAEGRLYAFTAHDEERFPTWQFTNDPARPVLPGLAAVIAAFPRDMHPATIRGFMSTPQRSARISGVPVTPVEWLLDAGDPQIVRHILDGFLLS